MKLKPHWIVLITLSSVATSLFGDPPEGTHNRIAVNNAAFGECFLDRIHLAANLAGLTVDQRMVPGQLASDHGFILALPALRITRQTGQFVMPIAVSSTTGINPGQRLSVGLHLRTDGGSKAPNPTVTVRLRNYSTNELLAEVITPLKKAWQVSSLVWTADSAVAAGSISLEIVIETPSSILLSFPTGIILPPRPPP